MIMLYTIVNYSAIRKKTLSTKFLIYSVTIQAMRMIYVITEQRMGTLHRIANYISRILNDPHQKQKCSYKKSRTEIRYTKF